VASNGWKDETFETKEIDMDNVIYHPIGIIHSPYKEIEGMPIQPCAAMGVRGTVEIKREYAGGLKDLDGFSHIILIYHFHVSKGFALEVFPSWMIVPKGCLPHVPPEGQTPSVYQR
jgi:hypothetical protein